MRRACSLTGIIHTCAIRRVAHPIEAEIGHGAVCNVVVRSTKGTVAYRRVRQSARSLKARKSCGHHGCQSQERYRCRNIPDGTAVKAAGTSDTTVHEPF
jgi:hypothetical protein